MSKKSYKCFSKSFLWKCLFPSREPVGVVRNWHFPSSWAELNESRVVFSTPPKKIWVFLGFLGQYLWGRQPNTPFSHGEPGWGWKTTLPTQGGVKKPLELRIMGFFQYIYIYIYIYIQMRPYKRCPLNLLQGPQNPPERPL